ncbi:Hypothetical predicted protein [Mytilus galloprovincialis]|uniref:DUF4097 domain-containing protein n=1 Tax=Mytilus galloprovincialis TaxID=29158 RepID=A0A8B6F0I0_MYTGA|nr:Hypothetical predicted protein [Mytilus galloprovincialis]
MTFKLRSLLCQRHSILSKTIKSRILVSHKSCSSKTNVDTETSKIKTSQPGLLETWFHGVERFGRLNISVPFSLDIESLDPQEYSDMGKLFIRLNYTPEEKESQTEHINNISLAALTKLYSFNIDTSDINDIKITAKFNTMVNFPATCSIQMPINYDLNVECTGKSVSVRNLETNEINIATKNSLCTLRNLKGENVTVKSNVGDIVCQKVVQGNLDMSVTGAGSISTDRIQGQTIKCSVEEGNISATSVYSTDSEFTCNHGNINLMNTHGVSKTTVNKGNLIIDSLDGSLEAKVNNGSTDIFISRPDVITIETETGDINIKIPDTSTSIDLEGNSVTCDEKLNIIEKKTESIKNKQKLSGYLSGTDGQIKAITKDGSINVKCLDWMESLNLKGFSAD